MADVPSKAQPEPGPFARAASDEVRLAMTRHRISGAQLAILTDRSQTYISKRLRNDAAFTANDIEDICRVLGEDLLDFLTRAVQAMRQR